MSNRVYFRHRWSHRGRLHRAAVKVATRALSRVPFTVKYPLGNLIWRRYLPYSLLSEGDVVVQVGAPHDTLRAGRSRALHLALCVGRTGRAVVIEPDEQSVFALRQVAAQKKLRQLQVIHSGAWSSRRKLTFYVDPEHPATNFTEDTAGYDVAELNRFDSHVIDVDSLDNILASLDIPKVDLVSITTNGSEREILEGMRSILARGLPHVALARTNRGHEALMESLGYSRVGYDDRGYTFTKIR